MVLCDTDILIEAFKNNPKTVDTLATIGFDQIAVSAQKNTPKAMVYKSLMQSSLQPR